MVNKDNHTPLVSVIMATFNEPVPYINDAISSILNQTYHHIELIIVDDSTNEDTRKAIDIQAAEDKRVNVIRKNERLGFVKSLNEGLHHSKGDFIARIDGDDIACKDRIEKQIQYFQNHPETDILGGAMNIINDNGEITSVRCYPKGGLKLRLWMIMRNPIGHPTVMFKAAIPRAGYYYDETMNKGCEDLEMWFRLRNRGYKINNMDDVLVNYRVYVDMAKKRKRDKNQNIRARLKNFSFRHLINDSSSLMFFGLRSVIPGQIISWFYRKENNLTF